MTERLPLFPLSTVLFPGVVLPLHIFEDRYRLLVRELVDRAPHARQEFGVVAIRLGREAGESAPDLYDVGCVAQLRRVRPLPDGRYDIVTVGARRFRVADVDASGPYLAGAVDALPESLGDEGAATRAAADVAAAFAAYLGDGGTAQLPAAPMTLSYAVAAAGPFELRDRQRLLAAADAVTRLRLEAALLRREAAIRSTLSAISAPDLARDPRSPN